MPNPYESPRLVDEYLFFHYADFEEASGGLPLPREAWGFATRVVRELWPEGVAVDSALDVGCAVGASSFELARRARKVTGVDFSKAFIETAQVLRERGEVPSKAVEEGRRWRDFVAQVPQGIDRGRVDFQTGDATNLPEVFKGFDVVLAANLICRLPNPLSFLKRLPSLVKTGGHLLLATPFSWLEDFTPHENWLGGKPASASGFEALSKILEPDFELEFQKDLPFLIREHSRKFQYGISLGSRWRRR
ncbi:MAG: putative 4-mercaptohistidine N1-methyltransferase [Verrucomicrobiota bacterium]